MIRVVSVMEIGSSLISALQMTLLLAEEEEDADDTVTSMGTTCTRYKMEIVPDKSKIMTNNPDGFHGDQDT